MNTFQIVDSKKFGGIETHILELCLLLKNKKIKNKVIFISKYQDNELRNRLDDFNIPYEEGTLNKVIKNNPNAFFHSHGYKANIYNKFFKLKYKHKTICSYHSGEIHKDKVFLYELLDKKTAFLSNKNIAISNLIKKQLLSNNTNVVYNFIFKDPKYKNNNKLKDVSFVGRLSEEKNPQDFIDIANNKKDLNFNIFGDGDLNKIINESDNIEFYGYTKDQDKIWNNTDVLLITSKYEGLPYVLIEAMSRGLIVISYKVGEIPEIINNGVNGFIVDNKEEMKAVLTDIQNKSSEDIEKIKVSALDTFNNLFGKKGAEDFLLNYN